MRFPPADDDALEALRALHGKVIRVSHVEVCEDPLDRLADAGVRIEEPATFMVPSAWLAPDDEDFDMLLDVGGES